MADKSLQVAVRALTRNFFHVGVFSFVSNLLKLTGPLYMLQIYDRVLASGSVDTLLALSILAVAMYFFMGLIDVIRTRILVAIGHRFDRTVSEEAFLNDIAPPSRGTARRTARESLEDVDRMRTFLGGQGVVALFDLPWMPIYLGIVFALHPWLGAISLAGAVVLLVIAVVADRNVSKAMEAQRSLLAQRRGLASAGKRNIDLITAIGMRPHLAHSWRRINDQYLVASADAASSAGVSGSVTKVFRMMLQSVLLGVGAYLALQGMVTHGVMVAASIIMSRGVQPIEQIAGQWRGLVGARQAWRRLKASFSTTEELERIALPHAHQKLSVDGLVAAPPGASKPVLSGISFSLQAGDALAVIGPSGSGKSTLARILVGAWPAAKGSVRLDGVPLEQYPPEQLGPQIGYVPQDVELFDGTVAENIARFDPEASDEAIVTAGKAAGVHELVASLDGGYSARVQDRGAGLSGGQRQRLALARALYGNPFFIVLDEPNSNLDSSGETALIKSISQARQRGAIVVLIAHRSGVLNAANKVMVLQDGRISDFGPKDEVIARLRKPSAGAPQAAPAQPAPPDAGGPNRRS